MAAPSSDFWIWSSTEASNGPAGGDTIGTNADNFLRRIQAGVRGALEPVSSVAGTNTITASAANLTAYASGMLVGITPAATNTGATTLNLASLGAKNVFSNGAACVGGELVASVPVLLRYDGTQFNIIGAYLTGGILDLSASTLGQIKFPATQNASANANTLDDYEEGVWTPSAGGTATYTTQTGYYTKIGNMVFIDFHLVISNLGTGSQTAISGLPFTAAQRGGVSINYWDTNANTLVHMTGRIDASGTSITFYAATGAVNALTGIATISSLADISGQGAYRV